ncbi:MAG: hypothetical protein DRO96_01980 [Candidatus Aenigmatarchaeota archaeon]|nr:MAG: hypothetical protein DRO96_01980 [Candidatus Aenigmarchaeota archaeon]
MCVGSIFSNKVYGSWGVIQREKYEKTFHELEKLVDIRKILSGLVLDVGAGFGYFEEFISEVYLKNRGHIKNIKIIAIDKDREMLDNCLSKNLLQANLVQADGNALPFRDEIFNCVVCFDTAHLLNFREGFNEVMRVLKNGGYFLITEPHIEKYDFIFDEIKNYFNLGFSLIKEFVIEGREKEHGLLFRKIGKA